MISPNKDVLFSNGYAILKSESDIEVINTEGKLAFSAQTSFEIQGYNPDGLSVI